MSSSGPQHRLVQHAARSYAHAYVHVPFCARRCSYCDFSIAVRREVPVHSFVQSIVQECTVRQVPSSALTSLYLGGGTPSRLGGDGVAALLGALRGVFSLEPRAELTIEANPEDITADAARSWKHAGVTRLSIGVQSFDNAVLQWMHRVHDSTSASRAIAIARDAGLTAFSIDLIFALPAVLDRDWARDLDAALALQPDHISLYGLTVEPNTPLGRWRARGEMEPSSDERYAEEFLLAHDRLTAAGYEHYEVSNFCKPGQRAVHNSAYWSGVPYLGLGPSAHGYDGDERRWNISAFAAWQQAVALGRDPREGGEQLTTTNREAERVYLGLRTSDGLVLTARERELVAPWVGAGWLRWVEGTEHRRVRCTPNGWLLLDRLASDLTAVPSHS